MGGGGSSSSGGGSRGGSHPGPGGASGADGARGNRGGGSSGRSSGNRGGGGSDRSRSSHPRNTGDATPSGGGSSRNRGGGDRDLNPGASDSLKDAVKGRDINPSGSQSGGSESIRGSRGARSSFSFNSPSAGGMKSFRSERQMGRSLGGATSLGRGGTGQGGIASGDVAGGDGLDRTTGAYDAIVGDGELSASEKAREARAAKLNKQPNADTISAQRAAVQNTNESFDGRFKMPGVGIPQAIGAVVRNGLMANSVVNENNAMVADRNLSPATLNTTSKDMAAAMNSASLGETTFGLLGNQMAPGMAAVGDYSAPESNRRVGDGDGRRPEELYIPPKNQPKASPNSSSEDDPFAGRLTNYGSYKRRLFQNL